MEAKQVMQTPAVRAPAAGLLVPRAAAQAAEQAQYLIFTLGGEAFAIGILAIKEIIEYGSLTEVPMMPSAVRGVINLRGAVVPVIDLSARFGRDQTAVAKRTCIVIVELNEAGEHHDVGVVVDTVNEVIEIPPGDIEPAPSFGAKIHTEFIAGMGKLNGKFLIILEVGKVLSLEEIEDVGAEGKARQHHTSRGPSCSCQPAN